MTEFSATECIKFGWDTFKKRPGFFVGVYVLTYVIEWIPGAIANHTQGGASFLLNIISLIVSTFLYMGMISLLLKAHDDVAHVSLNDLWRPEKYLMYLGAFILQMLALIGGLLLLIIPGIIFGIMFGFATYLVVDKNLRPVEALRESARITKGHKWELFLLGILSALVVFLGFICLLVGLLAAFPVIALAMVHAYRQLENRVLPVPEPAQASTA